MKRSSILNHLNLYYVSVSTKYDTKITYYNHYVTHKTYGLIDYFKPDEL